MTRNPYQWVRSWTWGWPFDAEGLNTRRFHARMWLGGRAKRLYNDAARFYDPALEPGRQPWSMRWREDLSMAIVFLNRPRATHLSNFSYWLCRRIAPQETWLRLRMPTDLFDRSKLILSMETRFFSAEHGTCYDLTNWQPLVEGSDEVIFTFTKVEGKVEKALMPMCLETIPVILGINSVH